MTENTKLELGIDIGTTFSSIAFINISEEGEKVQLLEQIGNLGLVPSVVLLDSTDNIVAYGQEALDKYKGGFRGGQLVREFKLKFLDAPSGSNHKISHAAIYKNFLHHIKSEFEKYYGKIPESSKIGLTHPSTDNQSLLRSQISQIAEDVFQNCSLYYIDEASATVQFIDKEIGFLTTKPQTILVIDSGGGTTDYAVAKAQYPFIFSNKHEPLEILEVLSERVGGRNIDSEILNNIQNIKSSKNSRDIELALNKITSAKEKYNWSSKKDFVVSQGAKISYRSFLKLTAKVVKTITDRAVTIINKYKSTKNEIQAIILAGGNSKIPIIRLGLITNNVVIKEVPENDLQTAVAKGAVIYVHQTDSQIKYPSAYEVHVMYNFRYKELSQKILKKNQLIPSSKISIQIISQPSSLDETNLQLKFTDKKDNVSTEPLRIKFDPPLESLVNIKVTFEVDANGYLRYTAETLGQKNRQVRGIFRKMLFDPIISKW
ncbi:MAG: Chaperone protein HscA [Anaerolineales bacterium]|nr:Chaperone protein HscA [Anaerolineales bacterium]